MPDTPCAVKLCTKSTCDLRSSSLSGPFQITSTLTSRAAFSAPAWTAFQNSCVVPLGMTATRSFAGASVAAPLLPALVSAFFLQLTASSVSRQSVQTQKPRLFTMPDSMHKLAKRLLGHDLLCGALCHSVPNDARYSRYLRYFLGLDHGTEVAWCRLMRTNEGRLQRVSGLRLSLLASLGLLPVACGGSTVSSQPDARAQGGAAGARPQETSVGGGAGSWATADECRRRRRGSPATGDECRRRRRCGRPAPGDECRRWRRCRSASH